jgi:NADPH2:quinone reductase
VIGIASEPNHEWLQSHGVTPVSYGDDLEERILARAQHPDAFIDLFGPEYVRLAVALGVSRDRIETIISFDAAKEYGVQAAGSGDASTTEVLGEMAELVASGQIEIPIAATYPLEGVKEAYDQLEKRHARGKIVLIP